jgi:predicted house-cleaning noncanonical NTP pyrophosphatase (MazG superfamily)
MSKFIPKLVRDRIPEIIQSKGKYCLYHTADEDEYIIELKKKLHEEVTEFTEDPCIDEAADVISVFATLVEVVGLDLSDALLHAMTKEEQNGAFEDRVILDAVDE